MAGSVRHFWYDVAVNIAAALLLAAGAWLLHRDSNIAAVLSAAALALFVGTWVKRRNAQGEKVIPLDRLNTYVLSARQHSPVALLGDEFLKIAVPLSAILLDQDQLPNGLWGHTILRYADLHGFKPGPEKRAELLEVGSITHAAHALRALGLAGVGPAHLQATFHVLEDDHNPKRCVQRDGHIYPLGRGGEPVVSNLHNATHSMNAARHTATGAVSIVYCKAFLGTPVHAVTSPIGRAVDVLHKHVQLILDHTADYTHAYVLEALSYASAIGLRSAESRDLAALMVRHLLKEDSRSSGFWKGEGVQNVSVAYFSAIIAERLLWTVQTGLIRGALARRAREGVRMFLERTAMDLTDAASGAVFLDPERRLPDYGTAARCARLAITLPLDHSRSLDAWLAYLNANYRDVVGENAHTHTWEAILLLAGTALGAKLALRVERAVREFRQRPNDSMPDRLGAALGPIEPDTANVIAHMPLFRS